MTKEEFNAESGSIKKRAFFLAEKKRKEGIFQLIGEIDKEKYYKRDVFEFGLGMIADGIAAEIIDKILTNLVNLETDEDKKALADLQRKTVLAIQAGEDVSNID